MNRAFGLLISSAALAALAGPALAHSTVKSTTPASGSTLPASPPEITIVFNQEARLTSLVVIESGKPERKLDFMPSGSATTFMTHTPKLANGRNEVKWKALSKDGHPIDGTIIIVVKPGAAPSAPAPTPHEHKDH